MIRNVNVLWWTGVCRYRVPVRSVTGQILISHITPTTTPTSHATTSTSLPPTTVGTPATKPTTTLATPTPTLSTTPTLTTTPTMWCPWLEEGKYGEISKQSLVMVVRRGQGGAPQIIQFLLKNIKLTFMCHKIIFSNWIAKVKYSRGKIQQNRKLLSSSFKTPWNHVCWDLEDLYRAKWLFISYL